jgi:predicted AlkP superfamily phosphohydrolase/phosphomutase
MVAGFPLPDYDRNHTEPPELAEELPPLLDFADRIGKLSDGELADRCLALISQQREIVMRWLREGRHEVMVVVFQSTDFAQHRLWRYLDQPGHPLREALLEMYRGIDALVGEARELMGEEGAVAVVSDHGFGPHPRTFVRTDRLLADAGLLSASGEAGRGEHVTRALRRAPALRRVLRPAPAGSTGRAARPTGSRSIRPPRASWSTCAAARSRAPSSPATSTSGCATASSQRSRGSAIPAPAPPWCSG